MNIAYYFSMSQLSVISMLPYIIGCYLPYWNRLKIRRLTLIVFLACFYTAETLSFNLISNDGTSNALFLTICLLHLVVYLKVIDAPPAQLSFCFLLFFQFGSIIRGISFFVESSLLEGNLFFTFSETQASLLGRFFYLLEFPLAMAVIVPMGGLLKRHFVPLMDAVDMRQWRVLFTLPLIFTTIILVVAFSLADEMDNPMYLLLLLLISLGSVFIYFVVFLLLQGITDNAALREQNLELGFREQYYTMLSERVETAKRARHDLRHHFRLLSSYLEAKDYDSAVEYLKECGDTAALDEDVLYCANPAGNLILNYYTGLAGRHDIRMDVEARLPERLFIQVSDVCVLLGNTLENAIEGCQRQSSGEKWIQVRIMADGDKMAVAIDNSCGETKPGRNGRFLSTKNGRDGIGLTSLSALAKKYDGSAWFEASDGVFRSSVVLHAGQSGKDG